MSGFSKERDRESRPSMDSKQIMDSLTDHIALYNSSSSSPNPNPNPRTAILRWFSALSVHNRRACLTVVDLDFTELLLQMRGRLETHGHGFFLVLPDIPSSPSRPSLPSLCFRRSRGLLARTSASDGIEPRISDSVRLFSSRDGEDRSVLGPIDSVTVSEEFVEDVDGFLATMDAVSHGGFLGGDENISWCPWEELSWLKVKGFYSLEAFVVNRLELALRMSWSCNCGGKKRAVVRMKDKVMEAAVGLAGNVFWRKKGCLDWWDGLDPGVRKKMILTFLGKAAQPLANEIVKGTNGISKDEQWFFNIGVKQPLRYGPTTSHKRLNRSLSRSDQDFFCGIVPASVSSKPPHLVNTLNGLSVLMEISSIILAVQHTELDNEKLFFSTLGSVRTVSDFILRRMRGTLMMVSIDHAKHELLGDANRNVSYVKTKEKAEVGCRRGNNQSHNMKGMNHVPKPSMVDGALQKPVVTRAHGSACTLDRSSMPCHQINHFSKRGNGKLSESCNCIREKDRSQGVDSSGMEMEHSIGLAKHKVTTTRKKKGRKRTKAKKSYLETGQDTASNAALDIREAVSSSISVKSEPAVPFSSASTTTILADEFSVEDGHSENTCCNTSVIEDKIEAAIAIQKDSIFVSTGGTSDAGVECFQNPDKSEGQNVAMRASVCPEGEGISHTTLPGPSIESMKICCDRNNQSIVNESTNQSVNESTSEPVPSLEKNVVSEKDSIQSGGNNCFIHNHSSSNGNTYSSSNGNTSYEWPSVAPLHFPPIDLQRIPAATDRLHLDVAHNWPNHPRQPIFTSRHHVRNPSFENGCSRVITSSTLPMSLDWPPVVRNVSRLVQPVSCNYDSAYTPRLHSSFLGMTAHGMQVNGMINEGERRYPGDFIDSCSLKIGSDLVDDNENQWISEEESDMHTLSGGDYNQFFGGGVMYWNASDHGGSGFSHPPSHSSEDGSWAWHEDDLNRAIDDMVGKPVMSSSYSTGGLASPLSASFESPFDLGSGHQPVGYILSGNDVNGKLLQTSQTGADVHQDKGPGSVNKSSCGSEGATGDSLPYPILRPIIVPKISRGSRSEFMLSRDLKSPCIATGRRELSRIKRPPSPVVLCVSQSPRPPPPSPVGDSRKQRGFPTVRSGSSSPRQWGIRNWYNDGAKFEEAHICLDGPEVFWPHWGNKGLATTPIIQPLSGPLLQEQMIAISQLPRDHEHPDVTLPVQPPEVSDCPIQKSSLSLMHGLLHEEIESFCKQVSVFILLLHL
ncbi:hypothetical protein QJS10_CPA10g00882 [Acorus calamus]|uniref:Uncharacterized protein n=1 Tax=Acorus calamus TaxID=4465 RepID=A0AAV9E082_ACOCL|nr:hypothetical protein QJS10_CPA10g00882 [Acorus calamus]